MWHLVRAIEGVLADVLRLGVLYVFVVIERETRRPGHVTVTTRPTADWTLRQVRELVWDEDSYRYLLHDRDRIFAKHPDDSIRALDALVDDGARVSIFLRSTGDLPPQDGNIFSDRPDVEYTKKPKQAA